MPLLLPAYIASLIGSAILVWAFGFLYGQYRERHLALWTWGWLFYTLRFILLLLDEAWLHWVDMEHLVHVCVLLSGYLLFLGTAAFVNKPVSKVWHLGLAAGLLWIPCSHLADFGFFMTNLPISSFYGLTSIWTGLLILRSPDLVKGGSCWLTGGSFILWGLHKLDYPVLHPLEWFTPWGFLLSALLSFTVAIGMLLIYFQQVRQQLGASQSHFQNLIEQAGDGIFLHDSAGRLIDVNRQACESLGYSRVELLSMTVADIDLKFSAEDFIEQWKTIGPDQPVPMRGVHRRKDGSTFPVEVSVRQIDDPHHGPCLLALVRNISARQRVEEALRASEEQYQQLFRQFQGLLDGIPDLLLLFDRDLRVVWGNRSAHLKGGELWVLEGSVCDDLQGKWGIPCDASMLVDAFSWGRTEEARLATPDGRSWGVKAFPVRNQEGTIIQVILWATDITEKSRLRDEAQRATRLASLGELAAGMAHEINNPNGLILLNLPVIFDCFADALGEFEAAGMEPELGGLAFDRVRSELPELLQETQQAARRIKRIVDDLKDFVRQEGSDAGELIDLNEVVRAAIRMLANAIRSATDHFILECAESLPPVRGSFQRIEQVVVNLTMNACQALPDRSCKLQLRTSFDSLQGEVLLLVQDQGVGIEAENLPHLTDPFFTTRRDQGGTGLGLSVSARIVREHEGRLDFNSTPGRGTIVTLRLPAVIKETSP